MTSPSAHDTQTGLMHTTPKKNPKPTPGSTTLPKSSSRSLQYPTTPLKNMSFERPTTNCPTPLKNPRHDPSDDPYPMTPPKGLDPHLVCPPTPKKDKRRSSLMKIQRTARRKRRLLLEWKTWNKKLFESRWSGTTYLFQFLNFSYMYMIVQAEQRVLGLKVNNWRIFLSCK